MALLFMDSFDGYGGFGNDASPPYSSSLGELAFNFPTPRTGPYDLGRDGGRLRYRDISPATATLIVGFASYLNGKVRAIHVEETSGGTKQWQVNVEADGSIAIYRGWAATLIAQTAAGVVTSSAWNSIEIKVTTGNSGSYDIKCNGSSVLSGSADTQEASTSAVARIGLYNSFGGDGNAMDDYYVLDSSGSAPLNDFISNPSGGSNANPTVSCIIPQTGNGANTGLTTSTGSDHGALVLDFPHDGDTSYNVGSSAGLKDTYGFSDLSINKAVFAVQATARVRKTAGTATAAIVARLGGSDYDGGTQSVASTSYGLLQQIWEVRPSDSGTWTKSDVDGAEFGLKVVSATGADVRLTNMFVEVLQTTAGGGGQVNALFLICP